MKERFDKLEKKLDELREEIHELAMTNTERLSRLETTQKGFITIFTAILTGILAAIANLFKH